MVPPVYPEAPLITSVFSAVICTGLIGVLQPKLRGPHWGATSAPPSLIAA